ncbi:hypothetical protein EV189_2503 [Motilibacter rhizosphaerae]|uniref:Uncharacterized protein n=1 Tax=Motilibacter rhizosphaerae TaxID=598652 RepID=A0A4Q7NP95_9ACTN|nr:hypothetical protein EV189_2503 [Motilibacter rhizosphaerae]
MDRNPTTSSSGSRATTPVKQHLSTVANPKRTRLA